MYVLVDPTTRRILGTGPTQGQPDPPGAEAVTDAQAAQVASALAVVWGDGFATISADHATIATVPPSAAWLATDAGQQERHRRALRAILAALTSDQGQVGTDLGQLASIVASLQAGTALTGPQLLALLRLLLRFSATRQ